VATTLTPDTGEDTQAPERVGSGRRQSPLRWNWPGGLAAWIWLGIVIIPIYWILITSFKTSANYFDANPLKPPTDLTFENYKLVIQNHFIRYFFNSLIVTVGAVVPAVAVRVVWQALVVSRARRARVRLHRRARRLQALT